MQCLILIHEKDYTNLLARFVCVKLKKVVGGGGFWDVNVTVNVCEWPLQLIIDQLLVHITQPPYKYDLQFKYMSLTKDFYAFAPFKA